MESSEQVRVAKAGLTSSGDQVLAVLRDAVGVYVKIAQDLGLDGEMLEDHVVGQMAAVVNKPLQGIDGGQFEEMVAVLYMVSGMEASRVMVREAMEATPA